MGKLTVRSQSGTITKASVQHVVNDPGGTPATSKETLGAIGGSGALNPTGTGLTAGTTQTQAGGLALTDRVSNVTTVANDNDAVTLKTTAEGVVQIVYNNGANILQVFPAGDDDLGEGVDLSTTIDPGEIGSFTGINTTNILSVVTDPSNGVTLHTGSGTLTRAQMSNGHLNLVNAAATLTMLATDADTNFEQITIGAVAVSIKAETNDRLILDGVALDDADKITNASAAGDSARIRFDSSAGAIASTNGYSDGGA